jgi:putative oxygen-independent coproporphyrinogen III oxidase
VEPARHAYVHVPFCPTICPFCDFHVLERRAGLADAYLYRLEREVASTADRLAVEPGQLDTLYLGGGTPSHLREAELARLVEAVVGRFGPPRVEATLEVHPLNVSPARVRHWAGLGFSRVSLGLQSTDDAVLRYLGRPHEAATALRALDELVAPGCFSVSADLITAVPGQDTEADLRTVAQRGVDHLSAYTLTIEPGTPFARAGVQVDPDAELTALTLADDVLAPYGLRRYEVSNHARPGAESAHNLGYWRNHFYLGLGPGAAAYEPPGPGDPAGLRGWRRTNPPLDQWLAGEEAPGEPVSPDDVVAEGLLVGLRLAEGVDLGLLSAQAGVDARRSRADVLAELAERGWLVDDGDVLRATPAGIRVLDQLVAELL